MRKLKLFGMKSHDCHVFMQMLLPVTFRKLLSTNVWQALTELSLFFKDLTSTTITVADMERFEKNIPIIILQIGTYIFYWFLRFYGASSDTLTLRDKNCWSCTISLDVSFGKVK